MVYFAYDAMEQTVKIGFTDKSLKERLSNLRTANPHIRILGWIPGNEKTEKQLHKQFQHLHHAREWFYYRDELKTFVRNVVNARVSAEPEWMVRLNEEYQRNKEAGTPELSSIHQLLTLVNEIEDLNDWEKGFIEHLYKRYWEPFISNESEYPRSHFGMTAKQLDKLNQIFIEKQNVTQRATTRGTLTVVRNRKKGSVEFQCG